MKKNDKIIDFFREIAKLFDINIDHKWKSVLVNKIGKDIGVKNSSLINTWNERGYIPGHSIKKILNLDIPNRLKEMCDNCRKPQRQKMALREEELSFSNAVEKLRDIYSTKDPMLIHTTYANLLASREAFNLKQKDDVPVQEDNIISRLDTLEKKIGDIKVLFEALPLKLLVKDRRIKQRRKKDLGPPEGMKEQRTGSNRRAITWPPDS